MTDISGISSSHKLTSQPKVSLETTQKASPMDSCSGLGEMQKIDEKMIQIERLLTLTQEIRYSLESAYRDLAP